MPRSAFEGSSGQYDIVVQRDVMIPMRDGMRLAMDIYRPALEGKPALGKFPALIERTPHDKRRLSLIATAKFFAARGFVCIMQDVRGRFQSEGDWVFLLDKGPDAFDIFWTNMRPWLDHLPMRGGVSPLKLVPSYQAWCLEYWRHSDYDDYWRRPRANIEPFIDQFPDIPVYLQTSWYAHHVWATTTKFIELWKRIKSPVRMLIGTWVHGWDTYGQSWAGDLDFGPDSVFDNVNDLRLRWFDQTLKGMHTGVVDGPPVRILVMGGGSGRKKADGHLDHGGVQRDEHDWPLPHTQWTPYYLHADGILSLEHPGRQDPPSSYSFNPNDAVPTIPYTDPSMDLNNHDHPRTPTHLVTYPFSHRL
jgi:predicted acyl esterase